MAEEPEHTLSDFVRTDGEGAGTARAGLDGLGGVAVLIGGAEGDRAAPLAPAARGDAVASDGRIGVAAGLLAYVGEEGTWLEVSALPGGAMIRGRF